MLRVRRFVSEEKPSADMIKDHTERGRKWVWDDNSKVYNLESCTKSLCNVTLSEL
eukprot:SAG22_NODE_4026_length_1417_cov_1.687405_2_plen_54_part_01